MTLAERLDTIRRGPDKRIPPDKRAIIASRYGRSARFGHHGPRDQSGRSTAALRVEERVRPGVALV
jgi:hypothetical protein